LQLLFYRITVDVFRAWDPTRHAATPTIEALISIFIRQLLVLRHSFPGTFEDTGAEVEDRVCIEFQI